MSLDPRWHPLFAGRFPFEGQTFTAENGPSSSCHVSVNAGWNLIGNSLCERSVGPCSTGKNLCPASKPHISLGISTLLSSVLWRTLTSVPLTLQLMQKKKKKSILRIFLLSYNRKSNHILGGSGFSLRRRTTNRCLSLLFKSCIFYVANRIKTRVIVIGL